MRDHAESNAGEDQQGMSSGNGLGIGVLGCYYGYSTKRVEVEEVKSCVTYADHLALIVERETLKQKRNSNGCRGWRCHEKKMKVAVQKTTTTLMEVSLPWDPIIKMEGSSIKQRDEAKIFRDHMEGVACENVTLNAPNCEIGAMKIQVSFRRN